MQGPGSLTSFIRNLPGWWLSLALALLALALLILGRLEPGFSRPAREALTDAAAPALSALSWPVETAADGFGWAGRFLATHARNRELAARNEALEARARRAEWLAAENRDLRQLLHMRPAPTARFTAARVIGDPGGGFVRTVLVAAGREQGVAPGQAVLAAGGLAGRVVEAGARSARVLLITDLNSRIPVRLADSRGRAVLAGDNGPRPRLVHLGAEIPPEPGQAVVSSGWGGLFPPGLPVGRVAARRDGAWRVRPAADLARLEHVLIVDYALAETLGARARREGREAPR